MKRMEAIQAQCRSVVDDATPKDKITQLPPMEPSEKISAYLAGLDLAREDEPLISEPEKLLHKRKRKDSVK